MTEAELRAFIQTHYPKENEKCEWKEYKNLAKSWNSKKGDDVESYISAIANMNGGHLVIGVKDGTLGIVGIHEFGDYAPDRVRQRLGGRCAHLDVDNLKVEAFETSDTKKVVWVIHIPKHKARLPVNAHGHPWQRLDDSLVAMRPDRLSAILSEPLAGHDWTAEVVPSATLADLDEEALAVAREKFKEKNATQSWAEEVDGWDTLTFLKKCRLASNGGITRAALLLLGKPSAALLLSPHPAQITWKLTGEEDAYEHFGPPFILATTRVAQRIRNVTYRLFPANQLLGVEIQKFDNLTILEALHNCIAHQEYDRCERIVVTETADKLVFVNAGSFVEGTADEYLNGKKTPGHYRNPCLVHAMVEVKMIDTMGYGIFRMTKSQRKRYLPLPDYAKSTSSHVHLDVLGRPIDLNYSELLLARSDLELDTVILLDRIQKKLPITDDAIKSLRKAKLIEGNRPNIHVAASVAQATGTEASYTQAKGVDSVSLKAIILDHLRKFPGTNRPALDQLLTPMLSKGLTDKQKKDKITNLLSAMKRDGTITIEGKGPGAKWFRA